MDSRTPTQRQYRDTRQRAAIKQALQRADRPLSPKEILQMARNSVPNLGIATVYRNIKALMENDELTVVDIPGGTPRYLPSTATPRHLFIDEKTDRVYAVDIPHDGLEAYLPGNFKPSHYQVFFYGNVNGRNGS